VHVTAVGLERRSSSDVRSVIGIGTDDDGLPLPEGGAPPPLLAGRDLTYFRDLLARARENTRRVTRTLTDADLAIPIQRPGPNGGIRVLDGGWALHHLLDHEAGHHAQINQLRHLKRVLAR
jgi:hypothetical protein